MDQELRDKKYKKSIISLAITCGAFITIALIFYLLSLNTVVSEFLTKYWARSFSVAFGHLISIFPFSVFEWSMFLAVLAILISFIFIFIFIGKKKKLRAGKLAMQILTAIVCIACIYTSTVTVSYNRKEVPIPSINNEQVSEQLIVNTYNAFMSDFSAVANKVDKDINGASICPYTKEQIADMIVKEYDRLDKDYFGNYVSMPKFITFSKLMSEFNILGITFTPFGEANVNGIAPFTEMIPTIAHELAHTKGVMRENDANLIAYYLLLTSDDDYFKYCGYLSTVGIMQKALIYSNNKDKLISIPEVSKKDISVQNEFWNQYDSLNQLGEFFNDIYLKLQGESGTDSYHEDNKGDYDENTEIYSNVVYTDVQRMIIKLYSEK